MSPTLLVLGAAKVLVSNRKLQLALIGLQFAYVTYKMVEEKKEARHQKKLKHKRLKKSQIS